ncbi:MAG: PilZ domain-containing protein [Methylocystis sp.]|nr:PilZ domain-containing protein [Methylocystis sp.]MCA3586131.1 PilZ domain-containing protein [Methylocystis sp.]MCA3589002.1 PilZ domain-containing protein [Methylocystis sp.]MCA3592727.1 PilZ domain-containing protein [Methylocystis sp.]
MFGSLARVHEKPIERRRHQRVSVQLLGRYMLETRREYPCQSVNISPGGLALLAPVPGNLGERVVVYLDQIGRVEGTVARHFQNGFAISFAATIRKRDKLAAQLTWLANREILNLPEDRRHDRVQPRIARTVITLASGQQAVARLIDVSTSGAGVATDLKFTLGQRIAVGKLPGKVVRIFDGGIAVEFSRILTQSEIDSDVSVPL